MAGLRNCTSNLGEKFGELHNIILADKYFPLMAIPPMSKLAS